MEVLKYTEFGEKSLEILKERYIPPETGEQLIDEHRFI